MDKQLKSFLVFFALFLTTININLNSQILPSYSERAFNVFADSLKTYVSESATEGAIDPEKYILGPGDKIFISISGIEETKHLLQINHEGFLYIPRVGGLFLNGKSLSYGKTIIQNAIDKYYKDVDIFISLSEFRNIKVSLIGDVNRPSTFTLKSNSRLLDLFIISGGLKNTANFRNISIKSLDGQVKEFDFLSFLRKGNLDSNPLLKEGDLVKVDRTDKIVFLSGNIKYPAAYEFLPDESVDELIELGGGLLSKSRTDSIEVIRFDENGKTQFSLYFDYNELLKNKILLRHKDHVIVRELPEYLEENFITIKGKVRYPGWYKISKNHTTLTEIINEAGGFLEDASLYDATLIRTSADTTIDPEYERLKLLQRPDMTDDEYDYLKAKSRQRTGKVVVDFVELFQNKSQSEDVILKQGDQIIIPEKKNFIIMLGQFVNPGKIVYHPDYTVDDYIRLAGGFGWRALEKDVRVIKVNTGEWIDVDDIEKLDPGDTIWVPEDPPGPKFWDIFTTSLQVLGQVAAVIAATVAVIVATR